MRMVPRQNGEARSDESRPIFIFFFLLRGKLGSKPEGRTALPLSEAQRHCLNICVDAAVGRPAEGRARPEQPSQPSSEYPATDFCDGKVTTICAIQSPRTLEKSVCCIYRPPPLFLADDQTLGRVGSLMSWWSAPDVVVLPASGAGRAIKTAHWPFGGPMMPRWWQRATHVEGFTACCRAVESMEDKPFPTTALSREMPSGRRGTLVSSGNQVGSWVQQRAWKRPA
jgi:hypothetical protein